MHLYDLFDTGRLAMLAALLVSAVAKATAVLLLGTVCSMLARGASAATRHMIWSLTLSGALAAPVVSVLVPRWSIPMARWPLPTAFSASEPVSVPAELTGASSNAVLALAPRGESPTRAIVQVREPAVHVRRASPVVASARVPAHVASLSATTSTSSATTASAATRTTIESRRLQVTQHIATAVVAGPAVIALAPAVTPTAPAWRSAAPWVVALWALGVLAALVPTLAAL